jgi:hypothetical protein
MVHPDLHPRDPSAKVPQSNRIEDMQRGVVPHESDSPAPVEEQFCGLANDVGGWWELAEMPKDVVGVRLDRADFKDLPARYLCEAFIGRLAPARRKEAGLIKSDGVVPERCHARLGFKTITVRQIEPVGGGGLFRPTVKDRFRVLDASFQNLSLPFPRRLAAASGMP